ELNKIISEFKSLNKFDQLDYFQKLLRIPYTNTFLAVNVMKAFPVEQQPIFSEMLDKYLQTLPFKISTVCTKAVRDLNENDEYDDDDFRYSDSEECEEEHKKLVTNH